MTPGKPQIHSKVIIINGFPGGSAANYLSANAGDTEDVNLIPGLGRYPGVRNSNPLQYSWLENSWTEEAGGVAKSQT